MAVSQGQFYKKIPFWIVLLILTLVLISVGSYLYKTYFTKPTAPATQPVAEPTIKESELPIAFDILQNPLVYEWRGSVEGTLTAKDDKSITLSDDKDQTITILVNLNPNGTRFFYIPKGPNKTKSVDNLINLSEIPIGSKLSGEFWVFQGRKNEMRGGSFTVIELKK